MREIGREIASQYLKPTLRQAMESKCRQLQEGAVIFNADMAKVVGASRAFLSSKQLCLCRGECVMCKTSYRNCVANHAVSYAISLALMNQRTLQGNVICSVSIEAKEFIIPTAICCKACEEKIISSGLSVLLWNARSKTCFICGPNELACLLHMQTTTFIPGHRQYFPIASV